MQGNLPKLGIRAAWQLNKMKNSPTTTNHRQEMATQNGIEVTEKCPAADKHFCLTYYCVRISKFYIKCNWANNLEIRKYEITK
jgi:hypothetical protein